MWGITVGLHRAWSMAHGEERRMWEEGREDEGEELWVDAGTKHGAWSILPAGRQVAHGVRVPLSFPRRRESIAGLSARSELRSANVIMHSTILLIHPLVRLAVR